MKNQTTRSSHELQVEELGAVVGGLSFPPGASVQDVLEEILRAKQEPWCATPSSPGPIIDPLSPFPWGPRPQPGPITDPLPPRPIII